MSIAHDCGDELKPEDWTFMLIQSWFSEGETNLSGSVIVQDMKERAKLLAEPFCSIFQNIPEDTKAWHSRLSYWPTQSWDNHNATVTLAGDAAHPMTFRAST